MDCKTTVPSALLFSFMFPKPFDVSPLVLLHSSEDEDHNVNPSAHLANLSRGSIRNVLYTPFIICVSCMHFHPRKPESFMVLFCFSSGEGERGQAAMVMVVAQDHKQHVTIRKR